MDLNQEDRVAIARGQKSAATGGLLRIACRLGACSAHGLPFLPTISYPGRKSIQLYIHFSRSALDGCFRNFSIPSPRERKSGLGSLRP